ncbi:MAG TPA: ATP-binding protein [Kofleriaceae bacterium]|jgi:nitrogen fixation/metabolism regulation signal transduction histidine kinase
MSRVRRIGLQWKLVVALLVIVMLPLVASYVMIDTIASHAASSYANQASDLVSTMEKSLDVYRDLFVTTKNLHAEVADRLSRRPELLALDPKAAHLDKILDEESAKESHLRAISMLRADGTSAADASRPLAEDYRDLVLDQPLGTTGATLRLTFEVPDMLQDDYQELEREVVASHKVDKIRTEQLPHDYRTGFLVVMALATAAAIAFGLVASRFVTRRIEVLVATARRVGGGQVEARVELRGDDELAELGSAFNTMLDDLAQTRGQIAYLQRIGAWQDVARRLAHEIKNPLTPIQLAVQQTVSAYRGDDERFKKQLVEAKEIVEEEIAGLRRLVDTFRTLGQLPKVEKAPLALADVIEELRLDPVFAQHLELQPPAQPVTVRADKLLLKRVLANLVENGHHAGVEAGKPGRVRVAWRAEPGGESATITVDDQGKGVGETDRDRIFEPYFTSKSTGTGLGLAIARKIAIEHGGDVLVAPDRAPTGGARFIVSLPLRGPDQSLA